MAEGIIQAARDAGVPIREDHDLIELLLQLDLHEAIPSDLYRAVAEILYGFNEQWKAEHGLQRGRD